jgi:hypothetical protein
MRVAIKMLMQLAAGNIGQLTDIEPSMTSGLPGVACRPTLMVAATHGFTPR